MANKSAATVTTKSTQKHVQNVKISWKRAEYLAVVNITIKNASCVRVARLQLPLKPFNRKMGCATALPVTSWSTPRRAKDAGISSSRASSLLWITRVGTRIASDVRNATRFCNNSPSTWRMEKFDSIVKNAFNNGTPLYRSWCILWGWNESSPYDYVTVTWHFSETRYPFKKSFAYPITPIRIATHPL